MCTEALYICLLVGFEVLGLNRVTFVTTVDNTGMNGLLGTVCGECTKLSVDTYCAEW